MMYDIMCVCVTVCVQCCRYVCVSCYVCSKLYEPEGWNTCALGIALSSVIQCCAFEVHAQAHVCMYVGVNVYMCVSSFIRTHLFARGLSLHVPDAVQEPIAP